MFDLIYFLGGLILHRFFMLIFIWIRYFVLLILVENVNNFALISFGHVSHILCVLTGRLDKIKLKGCEFSQESHSASCVIVHLIIHPINYSLKWAKYIHLTRAV